MTPSSPAPQRRDGGRHARRLPRASRRAAERSGTIADLGGGRGILLAAILAEHPGVRGILLDLPRALEGATDVLRAAGAADRCELVPGDFFAAVPGGADAYLLKSVIHDWDDERAAVILANVRAAMAPAAVVLLVEPVLSGQDVLGQLQRPEHAGLHLGPGTHRGRVR